MGGPVNDSDSEPLLDTAESARRLYVSQRTIRRWGHLGVIDARRVGPKLLRYTESSIEALKRKDAAA
jgi:DNA-binding transcriptional MerR regulator